MIEEESYISLSDELESQNYLIDETINNNESNELKKSTIDINDLENNTSDVIKNLIKSNNIIKSGEKNEYKFNKPNQNICLTNVTDDINSLRYFIELLSIPRAKIKDTNLLKIKNENRNNSNFLIPSGFQLMGSYPHNIKKIRLGREYITLKIIK